MHLCSPRALAVSLAQPRKGCVQAGLPEFPFWCLGRQDWGRDALGLPPESLAFPASPSSGWLCLSLDLWLRKQ